MSLENFLDIIGLAAETVIVALLLFRRVGRRLPVFLAYCICAVGTDSASFALRLYYPASFNINYYLVESTLDAALQFCVLVEVAWAVLQPVRRFLSPRALLLISTLILAFCVTIWPFARLTHIDAPNQVWRIMMQVQQTVSIVRVLFFLVLAASSQLLSLGWRDRELQVATGFGFYSLISVLVAVLNTHQSTAQQFRDLQLIVVAGFILSLLYWVFCFAQKEPPRRDFTPEMQCSLLSLAETAHVTRKTFKRPMSDEQDKDPPEHP